MNNENGKRQRNKSRSESTLLTTLTVVGGSIVAGAAVFYGMAGLMQAEIPSSPSEPFVLEVPEDFMDYTAPSNVEKQGIEETPIVPEKVPEQPKVEEKKAIEPEKSAVAPASTNQKITENVQSSLYVKPVDGKVQKAFSMGELVFSETLGDYRVHNGVDIAAPVGTKVRAMANGEVTNIYADSRLGNVIELTHTDGTISKYCNLLAEPAGGIKLGSKVKMGDTIAGVGESALAETAEATHIHLEVIKNGKHLNPETMFK